MFSTDSRSANNVLLLFGVTKESGFEPRGGRPYTVCFPHCVMVNKVIMDGSKQNAKRPDISDNIRTTLSSALYATNISLARAPPRDSIGKQRNKTKASHLGQFTEAKHCFSEEMSMKKPKSRLTFVSTISCPCELNLACVEVVLWCC